MALVVLVVYLFLQSWRATLIPTTAVPVSLIGTFAGMQALGFSINTLTLFGMVLAIGIVVDDAIVVVENVERHIRENRLSPREAAKRAMAEVTRPIIAIVLVSVPCSCRSRFSAGSSGNSINSLPHDRDCGDDVRGRGFDAQSRACRHWS